MVLDGIALIDIKQDYVQQRLVTGHISSKGTWHCYLQSSAAVYMTGGKPSIGEWHAWHYMR